MKYKPKQYAETLTEIMQEKKDGAKLVSAFLAFVKKNGDEKKLKQILRLAESLYFKKTGHKKVVIETARKINTEKLEKEIVKAGDVSEKKINQDLIAGVKVIVNGERQLDYSFRNLLN